MDKFNWSLDKKLLLVIIFLMGLGLVQVYSSSFIFAIETYNNGLHFFQRQFIFSLLGIVILFSFAYLRWDILEKYGFLIWVIASVGIILTTMPGLSVKVGGAYRWLILPFGQRFEPAELFKVGLPLAFATLISRDKIFGQYHWPIVAAIVSIPLFFLLKQPDFGTFVISLLLIIGLMFAFGLRWKYIFISFVAAVPIFYFLVMRVPYRYARMMAYLDPWSNAESKGFQVIQSMLGFHSGGLWGAGLGQGQGKLFFLPEAHTDFTLAVLAEEMGFIGFLLVIVLYAYIIYRGLQISLQVKNVFARATALGMTLFLGFSVFINVGVALGLLPTKGLTLPLLSYGGSSLVSTCMCLGVLLNIDRMGRLKKKKFMKI